MREGTRRPGAHADPEAPQSASDADAGAGDVQGAARQQRTLKRREAAQDAEADAFNQRHAAEVAEFNQLTKDACLGEDGKLDAAAIKEWQREHNVAPDGKVGPKTIAAAQGKGKSGGDKADDDKVDQPKTDKAEKKKGPVEDILSWLDLATVRQALQQLHMMAMSPPGKQDKNAAKKDDADAGRDTSGIASKLAIDAFAAEVKQQKAKWQGMSARARGDKMIGFVNEQLENAGVPKVKGYPNAKAHGNVVGKFHPPDWVIYLNPTIFGKQRLSDDDAPHMAATVYHEARHAEQHFRMAQTVAGQDQGGKLTAPTLADQLGIAQDVATAAMQTKIAPTDQGAAFGKRMFDDLAGAGAAHNDQSHRQIEAQMKIYEPLRARYDAALASKNQEAIDGAYAELLKVKEPVMAAWDAYVKLASEADAFQTEHAVDAALGVKPQ